MKLRQGINYGLVAVAAIIVLVLSAIWIVPAKAADKGGSGKIAAADQPELPQLSGIYVGVNAGGQWSAGELTASDSTPPPGSSLSIDGLAGRGTIYGIHGGIDWRVKGTPFVLRLLGSYQFGESEFDVDASSGGKSANLLHAAVEPTWKAGGAVGYAFANGNMVYAGYQHARADLTITSDLAPGKSLDRNLQGHNFLAGVEIPVTQFVSFALQYDWTMYGTENLWTSNNKTQKLDLDIDTHAVTGRLNIKLPAFN